MWLGRTCSEVLHVETHAVDVCFVCTDIKQREYM